jgi:hypothetical protein
MKPKTQRKKKKKRFRNTRQDHPVFIPRGGIDLRAKRHFDPNPGGGGVDVITHTTPPPFLPSLSDLGRSKLVFYFIFIF